MRLPSRLKRSSLGIYHFRVILPKRLRPLYDGRRELKRSLGTRDPRIARSMAYALNAERFLIAMPTTSTTLPLSSADSWRA